MSKQRLAKHYVFADNPDVIERKRLEMLERMQDPGSRPLPRGHPGWERMEVSRYRCRPWLSGTLAFQTGRARR